MTVEELQIIISAKTENVQAKIDKVKEKIAGLQPKKEAAVDVTTGKAQGNLKKLQTEISRTQAKINKLNEKMAGVYAKQDTIVGRYTGMPNLTGVPQDKSLDYMVGNDPQMQELNAQIERLEAETTPLKARLAETKAQISSAGNAAEPAAAKTRTLGNSMKTAGKRIQSAGKSSGYFGRMVRHMLVSMLLYKGVEFIFQSISEGLQNMALGSSQANSTMSQIASSTLYLKNSIAAALMPALQALTPVITQVADALANVFNTIGMLFARLFGGATTVTVAKTANVNYAASLDTTKKKADNATKAVKELQRSVLGFDELNKLSKESSSAGDSKGADSSGGYSPPTPKEMFTTKKIPQNILKAADKVKSILSKIKIKLAPVENTIKDWWNSLTDAQKWGAGIGGTAGFVIGGIIGNLVAGPMGRRIGELLGTVVGVVIGAWWAGLTKKEKWFAGIGAGAGAVIGGIIGTIIKPGVGTAIGAVLGGAAGAAIGKWYSDLSSKQKGIVSSSTVAAYAALNPWITNAAILSKITVNAASSSKHKKFW